MDRKSLRLAGRGSQSVDHRSALVEIEGDGFVAFPVLYFKFHNMAVIRAFGLDRGGLCPLFEGNQRGEKPDLRIIRRFVDFP